MLADIDGKTLGPIGKHLAWGGASSGSIGFAVIFWFTGHYFDAAMMGLFLSVPVGFQLASRLNLDVPLVHKAVVVNPHQQDISLATPGEDRSLRLAYVLALGGLLFVSAFVPSKILFEDSILLEKTVLKRMEQWQWTVQISQRGIDVLDRNGQLSDRAVNSFVYSLDPTLNPIGSKPTAVTDDLTALSMFEPLRLWPLESSAVELRTYDSDHIQDAGHYWTGVGGQEDLVIEDAYLGFCPMRLQTSSAVGVRGKNEGRKESRIA
jgi:hypothetical protein